MPEFFSIQTYRSAPPKGILYFIVFLFFSIQVSAQQTGKPSFTLSKDSILAGNGELAEFVVQLSNTSGAVFTGYLQISPDPGVEMVSKIKTNIELQTGESYYVSVKFMLPRRMTSDQVRKIKVVMQNTSGQTEHEDSCRLRVTASKSVAMYVERKELVLKKSLDSLHIPVRLINSGNTPQKIVVVASYPAILKKSTNTQKVFVLPAFSDTLVEFHKRVSSEMFKTDGFYINITGIYFNGEAFGSQAVNAQGAKSSRFYAEPGASQLTDYNNNTLNLLVQNLGTDNEWYQLLSNGSIDIRHQKLYYNIDASLYKQSNGQGLQLRNTFLSYRKDDWGFVAGNIGRSYDLNLSGRGIVAFMDDSAHTHYVEAGYVDKNQNLLGMGKAGKYLPKPGTAAWGAYTYNTSNFSLISALVYDVTPYTSTKAMLLTNEVKLLTRQKYTIRGTLNLGRQSSMLKDSSRSGIGAGIGFDGTFGSFYVSGTNYFSTPYYPGMTKGTLNLNERVSWIRKKYNLWAAVNYFSVAPAPIPGLNIKFNSSRMRIEQGISFSVNELNLSLSPSYNTEAANGYLNSGSMKSYHLSVTANLMRPFKQQSASVTSESGFYTSTTIPGYQFHQRTMMSLRHKFLSMSAMIQNGSFYLSEVLYNGNRKNITYMLSPQFQKEIFSRRGKVEYGLSFMNSTISGANFQQSVRIEYDYSLKTRFFAGVDYNQYGKTGYKYINVRCGVTLKLPEARIGGGNNKGNTMEVLLYRDMNDNRVFDAGDSIATNAYLTINSMIFITGPDGLVKYKNIPEGYYRVNVPPVHGWMAEEKSFKIGKDSRIEIPLQKTGVVKGSISYLFNQYSYEMQKNKDGVFISAVNSQGVRFTAMTNEDGNFIFYLPAGEYDIDLKKDNMPAELECNDKYRQVAVSPRDVVQANFVLKVKERKVETKKFTSRSVASANKP